MKEDILNLLNKLTYLPKSKINELIELPPSPELGDYSFPCFVLSKKFKKNPSEIAIELVKKIGSKSFEKVESKGPYVNFFLDEKTLAETVLKKISKEKDKYGSVKTGKGKKIVIEMSSPNVAKPFGIGHLRSTIIGNSLSNIYSFNGFKTIKINYLGDWGTPFGKIILGYKKFGSAEKLKKDPVKHLLEVYIRVNKKPELEQEARNWFKKLEHGDKEALNLWKRFRELSIEDFQRIYSTLGIKFDVISGESVYNKKMEKTISELHKKKLLKKSEGALIINLEKYKLGVVLIKKSDGTTLYATRDLTGARDRYNKYKFDKMIYEVGSEQNLYFRQIFKVLDLLGYKWAKDCVHVNHGLYLDKDGKKFATRKGKTIFMDDILEETKKLAKAEILKREKISTKELEERALKVALAAIFYGDLKNYRSNDVVFNIKNFLSFEGNTGPYLLYTYARAKSILRKAKYMSNRKYKIKEIDNVERQLLLKLSMFQDVVQSAYNNLSPNLIANYSYKLSQIFNEYYHKTKVIGSDNEQFRLVLVEAFSQTLKNSLSLLGISVLEKM